MPNLSDLLLLYKQGAGELKKKLASLSEPVDLMQPQERAEYARAMNEQPQEQQAQPASYYEPPRQTVDPEEVRRYMEMRRVERQRMGM